MGGDAAGPLNDDLLSPEGITDPHALFRRVREHDPVHWSARHRAWLITGHAELDAAFLDPRLSTERMASFRDRLPERRRLALEQAIELLDGWMLFHEPPEHTRLRAPLRRSFTPMAVGRLEAAVREITDGLLDDLADAGGGDLVQAFAHPLPSAVIARLFGVPDEERDWLSAWSTRFSAFVFGATGRADYEEVTRAAAAEFHERLGALLDRYRREPEDNLVSLLLATEDRPDGLSATEILGACSLLLFAGHDTTASLLGSGTLALLAAPDEAERLRAAADGENVERAVEELLRYEAPAKAMLRQVVEAHDRDGHAFEPGQSVFMVILAANRDPSVFDDPDRLDLTRHPNPHLTFGYGRHFCLGAALARLELRVALPALLRRFPHLRVDGDVTWRPNISDRSPEAIPVRVR